MAFANINIGIRHVLIVYPLLALAAAALAPVLRRSRWALGIVTVLVVWQAVDSARAHPDYLAYFNETVGDRPDRYRVDSDLDWGQDLDRLAAVARELGIDHLNVEYFGSAEITKHGLPEIAELVPGEPASGWVAVSLTPFRRRAETFAWLEQYEPRRLVGKSILLYYIPEASE